MKALIISHNPITTYQNMGKTFLSLFSAFDKSELCQLYIYPTIPDIDVCNSYYRITDREVAKSFCRFGRVSSGRIDKSKIDPDKHLTFENKKEESFIKKRSKNCFTLFCRDALWALAPWYNKDLKKWLEEESPTCIFLSPGKSKFIYNIALKISKRLNIDIYTYVCDEYYFVIKPKNIFSKFQSFLLKRKIKKTMEKSKAIITICDELASAYQKSFKTKTHTIYTGSTFKPVGIKAVGKGFKEITYMGNIGCGRYESIAYIGEKLDELNAESGTEYSLKLYTSPLKKEEQERFAKIRAIRYMGYVTGEAFKSVYENVLVHLHVEAFDEICRDRVKHSISTKIADALCSGSLLFAYGPKEVASISHLIRNNCAVVETSSDNLKATLCKLFSDIKVDDILTNAKLTAEKYHSSERNSRLLYDVMSDKADAGAEQSPLDKN